LAIFLSDPYARRREFGAGSVLNLPVQAAVKTGTSSDYRDAWTMGYDSRYTVGVWMGNLDHSAMDGVTGSTGPALVLRSVFSLLSQREKTSPLFLSPRLVRQEVCADGTRPSEKSGCFTRTEYFIPGSEALGAQPDHPRANLTLVRPTEGLQLAYDPRLPPAAQAFEFVAEGVAVRQKVAWSLNDKPIATTSGGRLLWPLARGRYTLVAQADGDPHADLVHFIVK
jgi:penicillin-binding protein 1C